MTSVVIVLRSRLPGFYIFFWGHEWKTSVSLIGRWWSGFRRRVVVGGMQKRLDQLSIFKSTEHWNEWNNIFISKTWQREGGKLHTCSTLPDVPHFEIFTPVVCAHAESKRSIRTGGCHVMSADLEVVFRHKTRLSGLDVPDFEHLVLGSRN